MTVHVCARIASNHCVRQLLTSSRGPQQSDAECITGRAQARGSTCQFVGVCVRVRVCETQFKWSRQLSEQSDEVRTALSQLSLKRGTWPITVTALSANVFMTSAGQRRERWS